MAIQYFPPILNSLDWGKISGSIGEQSDLKTILDAKANILHSHEIFQINEIEIEQNISSTNFTSISELEFEIETNKNYEIELLIRLSKDSSSEASTILIHSSADTDILEFLACSTQAQTLATHLENYFFSNTQAIRIEDVNDNYKGRFLYIKAKFKSNFTGTFSIDAALETSSESIKITKGTFLKFREI